MTESFLKDFADGKTLIRNENNTNIHLSKPRPFKMKLIFYFIVTINGEDIRSTIKGTYSSIDSGIKESIKRLCKFYDLPLSSVKCYRYETL